MLCSRLLDGERLGERMRGGMGGQLRDCVLEMRMVFDQAMIVVGMVEGGA